MGKIVKRESVRTMPIIAISLICVLGLSLASEVYADTTGPSGGWPYEICPEFLEMRTIYTGVTYWFSAHEEGDGPWYYVFNWDDGTNPTTGWFSDSGIYGTPTGMPDWPHSWSNTGTYYVTVDIWRTYPCHNTFVETLGPIEIAVEQYYEVQVTMDVVCDNPPYTELSDIVFVVDGSGYDAGNTYSLAVGPHMYSVEPSLIYDEIGGVYVFWYFTITHQSGTIYVSDDTYIKLVEDDTVTAHYLYLLGK